MTQHEQARPELVSAGIKLSYLSVLAGVVIFHALRITLICHGRHLSEAGHAC